MTEAVRLLIWDLDETFWHGTLTEGGITWRPECHDIVVELARRGIISTICSKNDLEPVRKIMEEHGTWEYFVFPSINWEAKGPRIAELVETVQLRAPTLMLIDDNPMNLNEAKHFVPGLQTEAETFIDGLLQDPRFRGKDDSGLTRLAQYKLLERRKAEETIATKAAGNNHDFLRGSNIRVIFEYDVESHIDRVVEMINRTNQLNFTKRRLPEEPEAARAEARRMLSEFDVQTALIRVVDNYGDYGFCGFYALKNRPPERRLLQFAFSCRILNMGVEHWLYRHLGRPLLRVNGDVLSDVFDERVPADWITRTEAADLGTTDAAQSYELDRVVIRGGCDLTAVGHYFSMSARRPVGEYNTGRDGLQIRMDHSHMLRLAADGVPPASLQALRRLGYLPQDFQSEVFDAAPGSVVLLSFVIDASLATYRHKEFGFRIPFWKPDSVAGALDFDLTQLAEDRIPSAQDAAPMAAAIRKLREKYVYEGLISEPLFKQNLERVLDRIGTEARVFILGANETWLNPDTGRVVRFPRHTAINRWTKETLRQFPAVSFLELRSFVEHEDEVETIEHFQRMVYYRVYRHVLAASAERLEPALAS